MLSSCKYQAKTSVCLYFSLFQEWDEKAGEAKEKYNIAKKEYKESGGGASPAKKYGW